jgi:hypothetical protein
LSLADVALPPKHPPSDDELLRRVREGIANCGNAGGDFPLDGKRHLFSSLRPPPGPAGALRLTTAHQNAVSAAVFLAVAIVGLVLTPRRAAARLWWLAGLVIAIVFLAVFKPLMAEAILRPPLFLAICLVLLVWCVRTLGHLLPGGPGLFSLLKFRRAAAATATALAAAAAVSSGSTAVAFDGASADTAGQASRDIEGGPTHE